MGHPDIAARMRKPMPQNRDMGHPHRGRIAGTLELCLLLLIWNALVAVLMYPLKLRRRFARFARVRRRGRFMSGMTFLR